MKVSARNVFEGTVTRITHGQVNAEVDIEIAGGDRLAAVVTDESVRVLGLSVGATVLAFVKAPWVMVMVDCAQVQFSARNRLEGEIEAVEAGPVNAEVSIRLPGGGLVHAVVTRDAVKDLGLAKGVRATALIKASHVILASKNA